MKVVCAYFRDSASMLYPYNDLYGSTWFWYHRVLCKIDMGTNDENVYDDVTVSSVYTYVFDEAAKF